VIPKKVGLSDVFCRLSYGTSFADWRNNVLSLGELDLKIQKWLQAAMSGIENWSACFSQASGSPFRDQGRSETVRLRDAIYVVARIVAGAGLLFAATGCIATRSWVNDQLQPINGRVNETDAKADRALAGLQNLHLEQRLVLDSSNGPTFAFGSAALTANAKHEIDGFFEDLKGSTDNAGPASGRVFVVAGHTDSVGAEDYNYELGQRRAQVVAGYLIGKEGVDPTQLRAVSYGASKPIAANDSSKGRRSNRRVEILVYQQAITAQAEQAGQPQPMAQQ
jgi:outer membrane protein OmpA-like peptidoglycan-associated protein